jgi:hypothetical protein
MKHIKTVRRDGTRRITIELAPDEKMPNAFLDQDRHYKLGYPVEDVVIGDVLTNAVPVVWCSLEQKWVS